MTGVTRMFDGLARLSERRAIRRWKRMADAATSADLEDLKGQRGRARALRQKLDKLIHVAEGRLALPLIGADSIVRPLNTDWAHRPDLWRGPISPPGIAAAQSPTRIGEETTLYHDCKVSEITLRQIRNTDPEDLAPFGMRIDVFRFDGGFLSLAIDLPATSVSNLKKRHMLRADAIFETEKPLEIFGRLNIRHGPNTEQIVREFPSGDRQSVVEFDLAYTKLHEARIDRMWLDLIFEGPEMNQITLRDLTLTRRPRAEI